MLRRKSQPHPRTNRTWVILTKKYPILEWKRKSWISMEMAMLTWRWQKQPSTEIGGKIRAKISAHNLVQSPMLKPDKDISRLSRTQTMMPLYSCYSPILCFCFWSRFVLTFNLYSVIRAGLHLLFFLDLNNFIFTWFVYVLSKVSAGCTLKGDSASL